MSWLVSRSLRFRFLVLLATAALFVYGARVATTSPMDVFPEFAPPRVEIQTEAPGLSTAEVEVLVTLPLEQGMHGIAGMKTLRSKSVLGLSSITLYFEEGTDLDAARQRVAERLATESEKLPAVAHKPVILPPLSSMSRALKIGISSATASQIEMTTVVRDQVRPRLMAVPGVANVAIWGQRDRELQVLVDPDRLRARDVSLDDVLRASGDAVAIGSGGFVDTPNQRVAVRHMTGVLSPDDLAKTLVSYDGGTALRLGDVADIVEGHPPPIGDAVINDGPGLLLVVEKQPGANTLEVTRDVEAALSDLRPGLVGIEVDSTIFRPATFIERSIGNLRNALVIGCALVAVILIGFLYDWRSALISLVAIPLSLVGAGVVLHHLGGTLNTMVLAGLVIATGEVVDDAIIDVENIQRRLRENAAMPEPRTPFAVVLSGSIEVRSAVVYASLIVTLVFLPVFFLEGVAGSFFRPLAFAYVLAILASLLVALTVTPALCLWLLPAVAKSREDAPLVRWLKRWYRRVLPRFVSKPRAALGVILVAFVGAGTSARLLGEEFLPEFKETDFLMHFVEKPGTSLEAMTRVTILASKELRSIPGVNNFGSHIGRAEVADEVVGPNFTELSISIDQDADYDATVSAVQRAVASYPGLQRDVLTYLKERIKEVLTGASAAIVVRIFGPDLAGLRDQAETVRRAMADVEGVVDLKVEAQVLVPQLELRVDPEAASAVGLSAGDVRRAATTLVQGTPVGEVYPGGESVGVSVRGIPEIRTNPYALVELLVPTKTGGLVPIRDVASVEFVATPNEIKHEAASRRIDVSCNVRGRDLGSVARDVQAAVGALAFERGYHPEYIGEYKARQDAQRRLLLFGVLSLLGIGLVLYIDFRSARTVALVFVTLPFALVGGVVGAFLGGGNLSLGSLVGFVTVLGIAARNGIMLVSHYRHLEEEERVPFGLALVKRGAEERLAPILMTALAAGLALLPIVVRGEVPGHEIEYPMALVIVCGLVTSTGLNLFLFPALYLRFGRRAPPARTLTTT